MIRRASPKPQAANGKSEFFADLQLEQYIVDELQFQTNAELNFDKARAPDPTIKVDLDVKGHNTDPDRYMVGLSVDLNRDQKLEKVYLYKIHLHIYGWFHFVKPIDLAVKQRAIHLNGSSILYGIVRTVVAQLTGTLGPEKFILPTVNFVSLVKHKFKSKRIKTQATSVEHKK